MVETGGVGGLDLKYYRLRRSLGMERSLYKVGLQPPHDYDTIKRLVAGNTQAHTIWVNMVHILKILRIILNVSCSSFYYNKHIVEIRGLTILGFKRR